MRLKPLQRLWRIKIDSQHFTGVRVPLEDAEALIVLACPDDLCKTLELWVKGQAVDLASVKPSVLFDSMMITILAHYISPHQTYQEEKEKDSPYLRILCET